MRNYIIDTVKEYTKEHTDKKLLIVTNSNKDDLRGRWADIVVIDCYIEPDILNTVIKPMLSISNGVLIQTFYNDSDNTFVFGDSIK